MKQVVVLGGTGYLGRPLITRLRACGVDVTAVVRPPSASKIPAGTTLISGNALDSRTYQERVPRGAAFVHLVGVSHPAPWKSAEFRSIDLASLRESLAAAKHSNARRFVFVSVAHPAPAMRAYVEVRTECEALIRASGLVATILRPWYVLGPGHRWPYLLVPFYKVLEAIPATRDSAIRLGLVTRAQMVRALAAAVDSTTPANEIIETAGIRAPSQSTSR